MLILLCLNSVGRFSILDNFDKLLISVVVICIISIGLLLISDNNDNLSPETTNYDVSIIYDFSGDQIVGKETSYYFTIRNNGKSTIVIDVLIKVNDSYLANQKNVSIAASLFKNSVEYHFPLSFDIAGFYIFNVTVSKGDFTKTGMFTARINSLRGLSTLSSKENTRISFSFPYALIKTTLNSSNILSNVSLQSRILAMNY